MSDRSHVTCHEDASVQYEKMLSRIILNGKSSVSINHPNKISYQSKVPQTSYVGMYICMYVCTYMYVSTHFLDLVLCWAGGQCSSQNQLHVAH